MREQRRELGIGLAELSVWDETARCWRKLGTVHDLVFRTSEPARPAWATDHRLTPPGTCQAALERAGHALRAWFAAVLAAIRGGGRR